MCVSQAKGKPHPIGKVNAQKVVASSLSLRECEFFPNRKSMRNCVVDRHKGNLIDRGKEYKNNRPQRPPCLRTFISSFSIDTVGYFEKQSVGFVDDRNSWAIFLKFNNGSLGADSTPVDYFPKGDFSLGSYNNKHLCKGFVRYDEIKY